MHDTEDKHSEIRLNSVNKIIYEWKHYKDFIVGLSIVNSAESYKNLLSRDGKYGKSVELTFMSRLFYNYFFKVYYENKTISVVYKTYLVSCFVLYI